MNDFDTKYFLACCGVGSNIIISIFIANYYALIAWVCVLGLAVLIKENERLTREELKENEQD